MIIRLLDDLSDSPCDDPELLQMAFGVIMGKEPNSGYDPRATPMFNPEWTDWTTTKCEFENCLQFRSYDRAARMLLPKWAHLLHIKELWNSDMKGKSVSVTIDRYSQLGNWTGQYTGLANTTSMAITMAALKAMETINHEGDR